MTTLFTGLSAFPPTPTDQDGTVDVDALGIVIDRLATSGVRSVAVLGSTGGYAYLETAQRERAVSAAIESAAGRLPVIVGIGAMRTSWSIRLARQAERAGADGLLLAPTSYLPLTVGEVASHFRSVAASTRLPICIYDNPDTTRFAFHRDLIAQLADVPNIAGIKMPPLKSGEYAGQLSMLRATVPARFKIGYSGDWIAADALLAGADAWYSVVAGLLPRPALRLAQAAESGRSDEAAGLNATFAPLWSLFRTHGSFRVMYGIADRLGVDVGEPPLPLQRLHLPELDDVVAALSKL